MSFLDAVGVAVGGDLAVEPRFLLLMARMSRRKPEQRIAGRPRTGTSRRGLRAWLPRSRAGSCGKASAPMNRLIVKPIPHEHRHAPDLKPGRRRARRAARPSRTASPDRAEDADLLAEEQAGGDSERQRREQRAEPTPASATPALAKPNSGTIRKATQGPRPCSSRWSGEFGRIRSARRARSAARPRRRARPATVAWTPDSSTAYQSRPAPTR